MYAHRAQVPESALAFQPHRELKAEVLRCLRGKGGLRPSSLPGLARVGLMCTSRLCSLDVFNGKQRGK